MQGWPEFIPTTEKTAYIQSLLAVGFDTIDFGSFVSPRAIPQMADTADVLAGLDLRNTSSKLLAIVANERGAEEACQHHQIHYLGFPFSISETFQRRNTNAGIDTSFERVGAIQSLCAAARKELVVYLSMGFGNPYGDPYSPELAFEWLAKIAGLGVKTLSLADTVGLATADQVYSMTRYTLEALPDTEIGVHLHSSAQGWREKMDAAWRAGCRRFDGALKGIGGCPMANDDLVGNLATENILQFIEEQGQPVTFNAAALEDSLGLASAIFRKDD